MLTSSRPRLAAPGAVLFLFVLASSPAGWAGEGAAHSPADCIKVTSKASLLHLGSLDSFDITPGGTKAAAAILDCVENHNLKAARVALANYSQIIPDENFGGEYTALQWFCEYLVASPREKEGMLADRYVASFYHLLADNDYAVLREYLRRKYHLDKTPTRQTDEAARRHRFHEDFILFNNPRRELWEKSNRIVQALGLKEGDVVADIGCGPGYYTFKFAELVGDTGLVFAVDYNDSHLEYVSGLVKRFGVRNVRTVRPSAADTNLPEDVKIDYAFMCSIYHILYSTYTEEERERFIGGIRRRLKSGGSLVVVDNALVGDQSLPYHGPYIAKELIIGQLRHHGFALVAMYQFIPQRYMLVFKPAGAALEPDGPQGACHGRDCIPIDSPVSLVQYPLKSTPSPGFTPGGRKAARVFYQALDAHHGDAARSALAQYRRLIPVERVGDEYSAFAWYCEYILAPAEGKKQMLADRYVTDYFRYLGGDDFTLLKRYVWYKYYLDTPDEELGSARGAGSAEQLSEVSQDQINFWGEVIAFNNPRREAWERSDEILEFLKLRPGDSVADVGCGPGYYTFKFSEIVGEKGRVYALDTSQEMLDFVGASASKHGSKNVTPIKVRANDTKLPADGVDVVFLCSLYHSVYVTSMEYVKDQFVESIRKALKKGGRLVIVDNEVMRDAQVPYYGPRIDRRLIVLQLKYYGFRLVDTGQFIPQRYVLVFQLDQ
jgi:ubiquinone/menaquinone biosynthesis C-methylase UbiE